MKKYIKSKFKVTNLFKLFVWAAHPHSRRGWLMTIIQGVHDVCRYQFWTWMTWIRSCYLGLIRLIFFLCRKPDQARPYVTTSVGHTPCFPTTNWRRLTRLKLQHCCKKGTWEAKAPKVLQPPRVSPLCTGGCQTTTMSYLFIRILANACPCPALLSVDSSVF